MRPIARRTTPSPAMLVAVVALFVALTGSAVAAATLSGTQIKKRSIPADRVKGNALGGAQINESRLATVPRSRLALQADAALRADRATTADTATAAETAKRADTATSADTAKALNGRDHTAFLAGRVRTVSAQGATVPGPAGGTPSTVTATCNPDEKAIGGGGGWIIPSTGDPTALQAPVTFSGPTPTAAAGTDVMTGWQVHGRNLSGVDRALRAYAICVPKVAPAP